MTAIFISHSGKDRDAAAALKAWLETQGHTSLFLDFDPEAGIRAGSDWEQTIYRKLRQCQAVIALLTPDWLASKWCFAEIVQAREKGKAIFPVLVAPCDPGAVLADVQRIDLTRDPDEGYRRLAAGLKVRGLDPADVFDRDPERPPYPGLVAFQEEDAAVFFGRSEEIFQGLETLDGLRRLGRDAPRLVLFLGASGSGKSSLVRAGLIPRLRKAPAAWLPVRPFRPQDDPLGELVLALAEAFALVGRPRDWRDLRARLDAEAVDGRPPDGAGLLALTRELRAAAGRREATVLLPIDQAEELLGDGAAPAAGCFLRLLRAALEASDRRLMALATLRSDFLGAFQTHPVLHDPAYPHDLAYAPVAVDPMPVRRFAEVIEGPARLAGLRLGDGLARAMVDDTGTRDALPLLAFTLRRLYDRHGGDPALELRAYEALGRLEGAVRAEADRLIEAARPSAAELDALRAAFVPGMVRIDAAGTYARRRAYRDELPARAARLLDRFVAARLLVTDRDAAGRETVEVAHEALLRVWPLLARWLAEDRDDLRLYDTLLRAAQEWQEGGRAADLLVHRDGRLSDARRLVASPRFAVPEASVERAYLRACQSRQEAEARARRRRTRTTMALLVAGLVAFAGLAGWAAVERGSAVRARDAALTERDRALRADSRRLAAAARAALDDGDRDRALVLTREAVLGDSAAAEPRPYTWEAADVLLRALRPYRAYVRTFAERDLAFASLIAAGTRVLTVSGGGAWTVWDARSGEALVRHDAPGGTGIRSIRSVALGDDGRLILAAAGAGIAHLWDAASGEELRRFVHEDSREDVFSAAFSTDGGRVVTASYDGTARVWDVASGRELMRLPDGETRGGRPPISAAVFAAGDRRIVTASYGENTARVWDASSGELVGEPLHYEEARVPKLFGLAVSADGIHVVVPDRDTAQIVDATTGEVTLRIEGVAPALVAAAVGASGVPAPAASERDMAEVWEVLADDRLRALSAPRGATYRSPLSPDFSRLVTLSTGRDGIATVWDVETREPIARIAAPEALGGESPGFVSFSPDGARLVTGIDGGAALWDVRIARSRTIARQDGTIADAHCEADGAVFLTYAYGRGVPAEPRVRDTRGGPAVALEGDFPSAAQGFAAAFAEDGSRVFVYGSLASSVPLLGTYDAATGAMLAATQAPSPASRDGAAVEPLAVAPDGELVVMAVGNEAEVRRRRGGPAVAALVGHEGKVTDAAFSPDGSRVVTSSEDGTARIWESGTGRLVDILDAGAQEGMLCGLFIADGGRVLTADRGGTVKIWDATRFDTFDEVIAHLGRVLPSAAAAGSGM